MKTEASDYYYLAGPMSGYPQFNIPAFDTAAQKLREHGFSIVSPAELDDPEFKAKCLASTDGNLEALESDSWGELLARDIPLVTDDRCSGVIVLPNWRYSRGARLEVFCAIQFDKPVFQACETYIRPIVNPLEIIYTTLEEIKWKQRKEHRSKT